MKSPIQDWRSKIEADMLDKLNNRVIPHTQKFKYIEKMIQQLEANSREFWKTVPDMITRKAQPRRGRNWSRIIKTL